MIVVLLEFPNSGRLSTFPIPPSRIACSASPLAWPSHFSMEEAASEIIWWAVPDPVSTVFRLLDLPPSQHILKFVSSVGASCLDSLCLSGSENHLRNVLKIWFSSHSRDAGSACWGWNEGIFHKYYGEFPFRWLFRDPASHKIFIWFQAQENEPYPGKVHGPGFQSLYDPYNRYGHWNSKTPICLGPKSFSDIKLGPWGRVRVDLTKRQDLTQYNFRFSRDSIVVFKPGHTLGWSKVYH